MAAQKYKELKFSDFKEYKKVPPQKSWAVRVVEQFLEESDAPVIGIELASEEEAKNRQLSLNKAIRDNENLTGRAKTAKRGTSIYIERI